MKKIIKKIKENTATQFDLQELVKHFATKKESLTLGEEVMFKEYIRKGAKQLSIEVEDLQAVYNSYRKEA